MNYTSYLALGLLSLSTITQGASSLVVADKRVLTVNHPTLNKLTVVCQPNMYAPDDSRSGVLIIDNPGKNGVLCMGKINLLASPASFPSAPPQQSRSQQLWNWNPSPFSFAAIPPLMLAAFISIKCTITRTQPRYC